MKKVFVFLSDGAEEAEAILPVDYLRRAGAEVVTVGVPEKKVVSAHEVTIICDMDLSAAAGLSGEAEMAVLPGGLPNSKTLGETPAVREFVEKTLSGGGIAAAICAAPALALGKWGLLDGKKFTCYPGMGEDLKTKPLYSERVIRDGNIITATGPGAAEEFAFALTEAVCGTDAVEQLKKETVSR